MTNDTKLITVFIPDVRRNEFNHRIKKINTLTKKLGLPDWNIELSDKTWKKVTLLRDEVSEKVNVEGVVVTISGEIPVINGYHFIAKIEHDQGGNLVKSMKGDDELLAIWHECKPNCDHCHVERSRNLTYILQNIESKEFKQVGSTCLKDFFAGSAKDPERIAALFEFIDATGRDFDPDSDYESFGTKDIGFKPNDIMAVVLKVIEEDGGYISREKAEEAQCLSTTQRVQSVFWGKNVDKVVPSPIHIQQSLDVIAWLQQQKSADSAWLRNVATLAGRECIDYKNAGLFGSGFIAWSNHLKQERRQERDSHHVGSIGEKISSVVTLNRTSSFDTMYGTKFICAFTDEDGNELVWKTTSPASLLMDLKYNMIATTKAHADYKGLKQTEFTRAKFLEVELFSFGALPGYKKIARIAFPDRYDTQGFTPLVKAVWTNLIDHAQILIENGADPNQLVQSQIPLLAYAQSVEMAQILLNAGADKSALTEKQIDELPEEVKNIIVENFFERQH